MTALRDSELYHPWMTYIGACEEARRRGDRRVGTDHLLLGLLRDPVMESALGASHEEVRLALTNIDNEALASIGVPESMNSPLLAEHALPQRPNVLDVWKGHMKMTPSAKNAIKQFRTLMRHHQTAKPQQLLLWLLDNRSPDPVAVLLERLKIDTVALRQRLEHQLVD